MRSSACILLRWDVWDRRALPEKQKRLTVTILAAVSRLNSQVLDQQLRPVCSRCRFVPMFLAALLGILAICFGMFF